MSTNSSSAAAAAESGDSNVQNYLAAAALVVSLASLVVAFSQVLQQYYGSTNGLTRCSQAVMGYWAQFTKRKFSWREFRFDVTFVTPVIFVARPTNPYGPLGDHSAERPILYCDGTNHADTHTYTLEEFDVIKKARHANQTRETVHTADNELASWVTMLINIQRMEKESRKWGDVVNSRLDRSPLYADGSATRHTMVIGLQEKTHSWAAMPNDLKKPYATSAMCHLIEIMAMLGIHWQQFDRSTDTYRAQGNGFIVTGSMVPNLGICFRFETSTKCFFQEGRLVPAYDVKQLCFGLCPTVLQDPSTPTPVFADEAKDEGTLQLGTHAEISETLVSFACNTTTVNHFRRGSSRTRYGHLFPVPFEMLGMLGQTLQIPHTPFTMLPNPTCFAWDKTSFSLANMLAAFHANLLALSAQPRNATSADKLDHIVASPRVRQILSHATLVLDATKEASQWGGHAGLLVAQARRKAEIEKKRREKGHRVLITKPVVEDRTGAFLRFVAKAVIVLLWFVRPVLYCVQPFVVFGVFLHNDFVKLLVELGLKDDKFRVQVAKGDEHPLAQYAEPLYMRQPLIEALHAALKSCDRFLQANKAHTKYVFALHIEELMCYLNSHPDAHSDAHPDTHSDAHRDAHSDDAQWPPRYEPPRGDAAYFDDHYHPLHEIDSAQWDKRDGKLMEVYQDFILRRVVNTPVPGRLHMFAESRGEALDPEEAVRTLMTAASAMAREAAKSQLDRVDKAMEDALKRRREASKEAKDTAKKAAEAAAAQARASNLGLSPLSSLSSPGHLSSQLGEHVRRRLSRGELAGDVDDDERAVVAPPPPHRSEGEQDIELSLIEDERHLRRAALLVVEGPSPEPSPQPNTGAWSGGSAISLSGTTAQGAQGTRTSPRTSPRTSSAADEGGSGSSLSLDAIPSGNVGSVVPDAANSASTVGGGRRYTLRTSLRSVSVADAINMNANVASAHGVSEHRPLARSGTYATVPRRTTAEMTTVSSLIIGGSGMRHRVHGPAEVSPPGASATSTQGALGDFLATTPHAKSSLNLATSGGAGPGGTRKVPTTPQHVHDVWCTLVFRMMLWLMLHDFHKKDVQVSKSEMYDSRLPVYIL